MITLPVNKHSISKDKLRTDIRTDTQTSQQTKGMLHNLLTHSYITQFQLKTDSVCSITETKKWGS